MLEITGGDLTEPYKPVEYFGREASGFTKRTAEGQVLRLEADSETRNRDRYGRLLRYVYLPDGRMQNAEIIARATASRYTKYPFTRMDEFRRLQRESREQGPLISDHRWLVNLDLRPRPRSSSSTTPPTSAPFSRVESEAADVRFVMHLALDCGCEQK